GIERDRPEPWARRGIQGTGPGEVAGVVHRGHVPGGLVVLPIHEERGEDHAVALHQLHAPTRLRWDVPEVALVGGERRGLGVAGNETEHEENSAIPAKCAHRSLPADCCWNTAPTVPQINQPQ